MDYFLIISFIFFVIIPLGFSIWFAIDQIKINMRED